MCASWEQNLANNDAAASVALVVFKEVLLSIFRSRSADACLWGAVCVYPAPGLHMSMVAFLPKHFICNALSKGHFINKLTSLIRQVT